jgi:alpha-N-arabinofuranosidase
MNRRQFVLGTLGAAAVSTAQNPVTGSAGNTLTVDARENAAAHTISRFIYSHFAEHLGRCVYGDGMWVGEDSPIPNIRGMRKDLIDAFRTLQAPAVRWPGGCYADRYHWKDGIGPKSDRPTYQRGFLDTNHFGTHEFMDWCDLAGCEPFLCGNVGSGDVQEMADWTDYITSAGNTPMARLRRKNGREEPWKLKYFAIGNENWGCGGNMTADYYADLYNRFATFVGASRQSPLYKISCGMTNEEWMNTLMRKSARRMQGVSVHHYLMARDESATEFDEKQWFKIVKGAADMDPLLQLYSALMDKWDPQKRIGIVFDEWGTWFRATPGQTNLWQQNTMRDAIVAGVGLNVFHWHCERVSMANIAQAVNVLQAMVLTDGPKMLLTPTYHVFEMYKVHQDAKLLPCVLKSAEYKVGDQATAALHASASRDASGKIHLSVCNLDPNRSHELTTLFEGAQVSNVSGRVLSTEAMNACNTFERPEFVKPRPFTAAAISNGRLKAEFPAKSVAVLELV